MPDIDLIHAIRQGNADAVRELLDAGADPNWRLPAESDHGAFLDEVTALMVAVGAPRSSAEIVRILLDRGADPFLVSAGEVSAVWYASGGGTGYPLTEANVVNLEPGHTYHNWGGGDADRLRLVLDVGGDPNESSDNGRSCVYEACSVGDPARLRLLIERGGRVGPSQEASTLKPPPGVFGYNFDILKGAEFQLVPLFAAAESGSLECVKLIVEGGFPPDFVVGGENALTEAGNAEIAEHLWNLGVRPSASSFGFDAIDDAIQADNLAVLRFLVSKSGPETIQAKLLTASGHRMNPRAVRMLIEAGADANRLDKDYGSPLHYACWQGDGNNGRENSEVEETIQALIDGGADPNLFARGEHPLHEAAHGDGGSPTAARALLRNGAQVDPRNAEGETPLMVAAAHGELGVVRVLLENGADRSLTDRRGRTAMDDAKAHLKHWKKPKFSLFNYGVKKMFGSLGLDYDEVADRVRADAEEIVRLLE